MLFFLEHVSDFRKKFCEFIIYPSRLCIRSLVPRTNNVTLSCLSLHQRRCSVPNKDNSLFSTTLSEWIFDVHTWCELQWRNVWVMIFWDRKERKENWISPAAAAAAAAAATRNRNSFNKNRNTIPNSVSTCSICSKFLSAVQKWAFVFLDLWSFGLVWDKTIDWLPYWDFKAVTKLNTDQRKLFLRFFKMT